MKRGLALVLLGVGTAVVVLSRSRFGKSDTRKGNAYTVSDSGADCTEAVWFLPQCFTH